MLVRAQAFTVVEHPGDIPLHKITNHSDAVEEGMDLFLRDLIASDRSRATIKTYAFVLCSWLNFLESCGKSWQSASLEELRDYILFLRAALNGEFVCRRSIILCFRHMLLKTWLLCCESGQPNAALAAV